MSNKPAPREIRILIIAKDVNQFRKHAQFLTRRGWPCDVVGGIKQAVEYVVKHRPMFVMVSFSIPTASITKLPNLLKQTFKATCIAFGEKGDPKTTKRLNACKLQHIFFGALSGPSIHMRIKKILIEMEKEKNKPKGEQGQAPAPDMAAPNPEDFAKANSGRKNPGEVIMKGRNDQSHQNPSMNSAQPGMPPGEGGGDNYWGDKKGGPGQDNSVDYSSQNNSGGGTNSVQPGSYNPQDSGMGMNGQQPGSYNPQGQDAAAMSGAAQANGQDAIGTGNYQPGTDGASAQPGSYNPQDSGMGMSGQQPGSYNPQGQDAAAMSGAAQANGQDAMGTGNYQPGMDGVSAQPGSYNPQAQDDMGMGDYQEGMDPAQAQPGSYNPQEQGDMNAGDYDASMNHAENQPGSYNPQAGDMNSAQPGSYNPQGQDAAAMPGAAQANGQDAMGMGDYQEGMDPAQAQPSSFNPQQGNDSSMAAANAAMDAAAMSGAAQANGQDDMGMGDYQQGMDPAQAPAGSMDPQADADFAAAPFQEGHPQDAAATGNSEAAAPAQFTDGFQEEGAANAQEQDRVATGGNRINNGNLTDMAQTFDRIFRMYCDATSDKISPIKEVVSLQAVTIKSETTNGYLLFGTPKDAQMRDGFFADMKENIQHELKSEFLEFYLAENFEIEVERVSFVDWASMAADFISVHQHGESELAMAYFSMDAVPKIKETEFENMCSVGLESVLPNVKANFNGYINFERNNKMLLYIKEGRSISQKQKERLLKKSIDDIYIPTENKENFCSLMAGECLNEKIKHYLDYVKQLKEHAASYAA